MTDASEVLAYLKQELPGFESRISVDDRQGSLTLLQVRGQVAFAGEGKLDTYAFPFDDQNSAIEEWVNRLIDKTRDHGITQLGLDKRIEERVDREVARRVAEAQREWELKGWERGYRQGYSQGQEDVWDPPTDDATDEGE